MIKINVLVKNKEWKKNINNPENYLKKKLKKLNKNYHYFRNKKLEFSLSLSRDAEIKKLNRKFRKKNKSTDILSFPFQKKFFLMSLLKKKNLIYLGDIMINLDKLKSNKNNTSFKLEFDKLWVHGFLHLLGHRHKVNKDFSKMKRLENRFIKILN
tara:strand:- start:239 stop:703 length:465 start_codon:yes stop_codon:yes gene_type:complete